MKKACFIIPYYGKFPNYFDLWLNSAAANGQVDFLFLTDIVYTGTLPENVKFLDISLEEIARRVEEKLHITPALEKAYKLCDLKPAYGFLFPELVWGYKFWGFIDVDIVFGDMSCILTDELFEKYDKIGQQGHLTLLRNCEKCNTLFLASNDKGYPDYRTVFSNPYTFHFDESGLFANAADYGVSCCAVPDYYDVMPHKFPFLVMVGKGQFAKSVPEYRDGKLYLHYLIGGEVKTRELLYVHFQKRAMDMPEGLDKNHYLAVPNRFASWEPIDASFLEKHNESRIYWQWYRTRLKMIVENVRNGALKRRGIF